MASPFQVTTLAIPAQALHEGLLTNLLNPNDRDVVSGPPPQFIDPASGQRSPAG
jgi:hypothetical protein